MQAAAADGRPPLVFFHDGDAAGGALAASLQRGLGSEPPVLAIDCHGPHGKTMPRSIQDTAAAQLSAILRAQPHGPYRLGGYRNGALIALQAARLLVAAGREVALVALVDPPTITAHRPLQFLLSLVGRITRKQGTDETAGDLPAPLAVPLLVPSSSAIDAPRPFRSARPYIVPSASSIAFSVGNICAARSMTFGAWGSVGMVVTLT